MKKIVINTHYINTHYINNTYNTYNIKTLMYVQITILKRS